jgi:hypothetical protein
MGLDSGHGISNAFDVAYAFYLNGSGVGAPGQKGIPV